jgi:hypothetical protein
MDNRDSKRRTVSRKAAVWTGTRGIPCDVIDASETGCRIRLKNPSELGDFVKVHVAGLPDARPGRVMWRSAQEAGIKFGSWPEEETPAPAEKAD